MKGWISAALLFTFLSGSTTGYLVARSSTPPVKEQSRIEAYLLELTKQGVTDPGDLEAARRILEEREKKVLALTSKVKLLLKDQFDSINLEAQERIEAIMAKYPK